MPRTKVHFFSDPRTGRVPVLDWLDRLGRESRVALERCRARIERLAEEGHALRRPEAAYLAEGLYELRIRVGRSQLRILYFFHGKGTAVLVHGLSKERRIPEADLGRALDRMRRYRRHPREHTYTEDSDE